jgi:hydroxymethylglutaryl-CoA lyase
MLSVLNRNYNIINLLSDVTFPNFVKINEISMTYGIQKINHFIPTTKKINIINKFSHCGLNSINVTNFVNPKLYNQFKDHNEVFNKIQKIPNINYNILIPNIQGLNNAINNNNIRYVTFFIGSTDKYNQQIYNMDLIKSLNHVIELIDIANMNDIKCKIIIYGSLECPYSGKIKSSHISMLTQQLLNRGCYEICLSDNTQYHYNKTRLLDKLLLLLNDDIDLSKISIQINDKKSTECIKLALSYGINKFDTSIINNFNTIDFINYLEKLNIDTNIDLNKLYIIHKDLKNIID